MFARFSTYFVGISDLFRVKNISNSGVEAFVKFLIMIPSLFLALFVTIFVNVFKEKSGAFSGALITIVIMFFLGYFSDSEDVDLTTNKVVSVETGSLAGRSLGDLYVPYLGLPGSHVVPDTLQVNFYKQLESMWKRKERRSNNGVVNSTKKLVLERYQTKTTCTLSEYEDHVNDVASDLFSSINWSRVADARKLSDNQIEQLKKAVKKIGGQELLAYAMTELMPSNDGEVNREVMDLLLQNAGREYLELIPAMNDKLTSFGLYQFTSYAVYDTPKERRGASVINQALPASLQIPGSVNKLVGDDHHKAAWLFMIANLSHLSKKGFDVSDLSQIELVQFVAMAHHNPSNALKWHTGGISQNWKKRLSKYAKKTKRNYKALQNLSNLSAEVLFLF